MPSITPKFIPPAPPNFTPAPPPKFWSVLTAAILIAIFSTALLLLSLDINDQIVFTDQIDITTPSITIADPQLGPPDAPIIIVNYGDYACPACQELESVLKELVANYPTPIKIVWKDLPNSSLHPTALPAAIASRCAGEQGRFWDYHSALMYGQISQSTEDLLALANGLELKIGAFTKCLESQATLPFIERSFTEGVSLGIVSTPTLYINGKIYADQLSVLELTRALNQLEL